VGPRAGLDAEAKRKITAPSGNRNPVVQHAVYVTAKEAVDRSGGYIPSRSRVTLLPNTNNEAVTS